MLRNRLFNVLLVAAVALLTALTFREAFATAMVVSQPPVVECANLPSRYSIHKEIIEETGTLVLYSEDGPVGVDGGLKELMSAYRTCSR